MEFIVTLVGIVGVLVAIMFTLAIRNVAGLRLKKPIVELRSDSELPAYLNELFKPAEAQLRALGFDRLQCLYRHSFISHDMSGKWSVLFGHRQESAYAEVTLNTVPSEMPGYEVSFATIFTNDFLLQTLNCRKHGLFVEIPKVIFVDPYMPGIAEVWQAHRAKGAELGREKSPFPLWPLLYVARQQLAGEQMVEEAYAKGIARATPDREYAFKLLRTFPIAWKLMIGQLQMGRIQQARKKQAEVLNEAVPVEAEVESFLHIQSIGRKKPMGRLGKTLVLLMSVMLFSISFGITFSLRTVLLLVGAVMFHEMGHFLGMYLCGYRNLHVMFVPFLGAVAYGEEHETQPFHRVIVLLLGPLPGIFLGVAGLLLNVRLQTEWLNEATTLLLILNLFNLLPIMPLDGGQLVRTLLFQRFPRIQALFHILSTVIFGVWAMLSNDAVLRALCVVMCLGIPMQWRHGRALVRMKKGMAEFIADERQRLAHFFSVLRDKQFARIPFAKKAVIVKTAERELRSATPSWKLITATMLLYGLAVFVPLVAIAVAPLTARTVISVAASVPGQADWDARIESATTPDERFSLLLEAGEWCTIIEEDETAAKGYLEKAHDLARTFGENDIRVANSCISLAAVVDSSRAGELLEQALYIQEQQLGSDHPDVADTLQRLASTRRQSAAIPLLERRIAILERTKGETSQEVIIALHQLVLLYDSAHRDREAEESLLRCRAMVVRNPENAGLEWLNRDLAIYYAVHDRLNEAEELLNEEIARVENSFFAARWIQDLAWIQTEQGKGDEAVKTLVKALVKQRAAQKDSASSKKIGVLNYLILKVLGSEGRKWYSEETGASMLDIPLLLDLSAITFALGWSDEARAYFGEAQQVETTYGGGDGGALNLSVYDDEPQTEEATDFLQTWRQKKIRARKEVTARFSGDAVATPNGTDDPVPGALPKPGTN